MTNTETNESHPAEELETIIVDPDDVIGMMRRNERDRDENRSHVLRVTPPLKGERKAKLHVSEDYSYYSPDMSVYPIHIEATTLFEGRSDAQLDPELKYPDYGLERSIFQDEYDSGMVGGDGDREEKWEEWWETCVEVWEENIRGSMSEPREIQLGGYFAEEPSTTVQVRFEETGRD